MRSTCIFLFYRWRPKTWRKSVTASQSTQSWGMNLVFLCPNRKNWEMKSCTFPLVCLYSSNAVMCYSNLCWSLKRLKSPVVIFHIHIFLYLPEWANQLCHHLCNLDRKWLNMVSTDSCICPHYLSRVIVFSVCLKPIPPTIINGKSSATIIFDRFTTP